MNHTTKSEVTITLTEKDIETALENHLYKLYPQLRGYNLYNVVNYHTKEANFVFSNVKKNDIPESLK